MNQEYDDITERFLKERNISEKDLEEMNHVSDKEYIKKISSFRLMCGQAFFVKYLAGVSKK